MCHTVKSVRPEGSSLAKNGKNLTPSEQQLTHHPVPSPVKSISTSSRVEMETA